MSPFRRPSHSPPDVDWGYRKRTGRRGHYRYWYEETLTKKLYLGHRPTNYRIKNSPKLINHPSASKIVSNPWSNYDTMNPELMETESGALMNYYGLTDVIELSSYEDLGFNMTINEILRFVTMKSPITLQLILNIHDSIFWRIYPWAGRYRTVNIAKAKFRWPPYINIQTEMKKYSEEVLSKLTPARFPDNERQFEDAAIAMGDFLIIHPFREGNGRVAKLIGAILLLQAGFPFINPNKIKKADLVSASLDSYCKNYTPLTNLLKYATLNA